MSNFMYEDGVVRDCDKSYTDNLLNGNNYDNENDSNNAFILASIKAETDLQLKQVLMNSYEEKLRSDKIAILLKESDERAKQKQLDIEKNKIHLANKKKELEAIKKLEQEARKEKVEHILVWICRMKKLLFEDDKRITRIQENIYKYINNDDFIMLDDLRFLINKGMNKVYMENIENEILYNSD